MKLTAEEFLQNHLRISYFYDDKTNQMVCYGDEVQQAMIEFAKLYIADIDHRLSVIEDYAKGEVGDEITKLRMYINEITAEKT
jgi:hypothetical protein